MKSKLPSSYETRRL